MKKSLLYSVLMLVAVAFASCEKDKEKVTADFLQGKWRMVYMSDVYMANGEVIEEEIMDFTSGEYADYLVIWDFTKNGQLIIADEDSGLIYSLSEDGSKLVLSYEGEEEAVFDVHKNSDKEIELSISEKEEYDGVVYSGKVTVILQKQ